MEDGPRWFRELHLGLMTADGVLGTNQVLLNIVIPLWLVEETDAPRVLLAFEDHIMELREAEEPEDRFTIPLIFTWSLPPLPSGPDLLVLATDLAGVGGTDLPIEVSAIDTYASVTDPAERSLTIVARVEVSLGQVFMGTENLADELEKCGVVSEFLLDRAPAWLED